MGNKQVHPNEGGGKNSRKDTPDSEIVAEVDDDLENGPVFKRHCTDILCCPLFMIFWAGMVWAFVYGLSNGDPWKLTTLFDTDGNGCGHDSGFEDYDLIYWPDITYSTSFSEVSSKTTWVKFWPTRANPLTSSDCVTNSLVTSCTTNDNYDSKAYLKKFCLPDKDSANYNSTYG